MRASTGAWDGRMPIAFHIHWNRCAADGTACAPLKAATAAGDAA